MMQNISSIRKIAEIPKVKTFLNRFFTKLVVREVESHQPLSDDEAASSPSTNLDVIAAPPERTSVSIHRSVSFLLAAASVGVERCRCWPTRPTVRASSIKGFSYLYRAVAGPINKVVGEASDWGRHEVVVIVDTIPL